MISKTGVSMELFRSIMKLIGVSDNGILEVVEMLVWHNSVRKYQKMNCVCFKNVKKKKKRSGPYVRKCMCVSTLMFSGQGGGSGGGRCLCLC